MVTEPQQQAMPPLPDASGHALVAYGRVQHLCISAEVAETLLDKYLDRADPGGAHIEFLFSRAQLDAYATEAVARALAASAPSREAPEGWKLVPIEPTREMLRRHSENVDGLDEWRAKQDWHNMLSAAPSTSGEGGKEGDDHA